MNKQKKYQYLYLRYKLIAKLEKNTWYYNEKCGFDTEEEDNKINKILNWLNKINTKYNYA